MRTAEDARGGGSAGAGTGGGSGSPGHPVAVFAARVRARGEELATVPVASMGLGPARQALDDLDAAIAQLQALRAGVLVGLDELGVAADAGAVSTATWLAATTRTTRREAHASMRLAAGLERHRRLHEAFAHGRVHQEQAAVIVRALEELPSDLDPALRARAEADLVALAAAHDAVDLRRLGRRILEVAAPDAADAHEAAALAREERKAAAGAWLTLTDDGHGSCDGRFHIPALHGGMVRKYLLALTSPRRDQEPHEPGEPRTSRERMGQAFVELIETFPVDRLPTRGGVAATVVVTMELDSLLGGLRAAQLDTGERISAGEARRLACAAGLIPAVLGTGSVVLDAGRKARLHTEPQRIAIGIEQRTYRTEGCDTPPGLCQLHHPQPWSLGGTTSTRNALLLCPHHHRLAHNADYHVTHLADGRLRFTRRRE